MTSIPLKRQVLTCLQKSLKMLFSTKIPLSLILGMTTSTILVTSVELFVQTSATSVNCHNGSVITRKNSWTSVLSSTVLVESAVRNSQAGWCVKATKMSVNCMAESPLTGKTQKFKANCGMGKCTSLTSGLQSMSTMSIQALSEKTGLMEHHANAMSTVEILSVTVAS